MTPCLRHQNPKEPSLPTRTKLPAKRKSRHQTMEPGAAARYVNTWLKTIAGGFIIEAYDPQGDETEQKHLLETMIDGRTHVKLTDTVRAGPTKTGP